MQLRGTQKASAPNRMPYRRNKYINLQHEPVKGDKGCQGTLSRTDAVNGGKVLAFVEVRLRNRDSHGGGAASVTPAKQRRIARAAALYLQRCDKNCGCRFDVMEVRQLAAGRFSMRWIRNAFETPAAAF